MKNSFEGPSPEELDRMREFSTEKRDKDLEQAIDQLFIDQVTQGDDRPDSPKYFVDKHSALLYALRIQNEMATKYGIDPALKEGPGPDRRVLNFFQVYDLGYITKLIRKRLESFNK